MVRTLSLLLWIASVLLGGGSLWISAEPLWNSLRVTWGWNIMSPNIYARMPRTETKARNGGFNKIPGECEDGNFLGIRYIKDIDPAVVLLYDCNGYIAGIQTGFPKREIEKAHSAYPFATTPTYQLDTIAEEEVYFLTAYFVDPSIICNGGRTKDQFNYEGTGTGLYLQNGTDPIYDTIQIPFYEKYIDSMPSWVRGGCFVTMGVHYWYDFRQDMDCNKLFPFVPIYSRGKLTDFFAAAFGNYNFSTRFEHPPSTALVNFLPLPIPQCFYNEYERSGGFSTFHIYFVDRPWKLYC